LEVVHVWFIAQPKPLLPDGIEKLNKWWIVGIDMLDNYMGEGEHSSKFSNAHVLIVENIPQISSD
jgi:hypothetical protein